MNNQNENPGAGGSGYRSTGETARLVGLVVTWLPGQDPVLFSGREAQTLFSLYRAGARGLTSGDFSAQGWARRTSAYVHNLRKAGLNISTTREVAPPDANVGRYRLQSRIVILVRFGLD